jgi:hypothetical protein
VTIHNEPPCSTTVNGVTRFRQGRRVERIQPTRSVDDFIFSLEISILKRGETTRTTCFCGVGTPNSGSTPTSGTEALCNLRCFEVSVLDTISEDASVLLADYNHSLLLTWMCTDKNSGKTCRLYCGEPEDGEIYEDGMMVFFSGKEVGVNHVVLDWLSRTPAWTSVLASPLALNINSNVRGQVEASVRFEWAGEAEELTYGHRGSNLTALDFLMMLEHFMPFK